MLSYVAFHSIPLYSVTLHYITNGSMEPCVWWWWWSSFSTLLQVKKSSAQTSYTYWHTQSYTESLHCTPNDNKLQLKKRPPPPSPPPPPFPPSNILHLPSALPFFLSPATPTLGSKADAILKALKRSPNDVTWESPGIFSSVFIIA